MSDHPAPHPDGLRLRVLSLNIQVGLLTQNYRHYVTRAWRHVLPSRHARENLKRVAALAADYDLVALQEADAGSLRTCCPDRCAYQHICASEGCRADQSRRTKGG